MWRTSPAPLCLAAAPHGLRHFPQTRTLTMDADSLQRLVTMQMPYGKYKGRALADLPGNYLNWFAREGFPSGELGRLLALMHDFLICCSRCVAVRNFDRQPHYHCSPKDTYDHPGN